MTPDELRQWREQRNLTRAALAALLPTKERTIERWEQGRGALPSFLPRALNDVSREIPRRIAAKGNNPMPDKLTYHDVVVYVNDESHRITDNYAYLLTCTRTGGWELWAKTEVNGEKLLGGEYSDEPFRIEVKGMVICDNGIARVR